jgi:hypothetical protein
MRRLAAEQRIGRRAETLGVSQHAEQYGMFDVIAGHAAIIIAHSLLPSQYRPLVTRDASGPFDDLQFVEPR